MAEKRKRRKKKKLSLCKEDHPGYKQQHNMIHWNICKIIMCQQQKNWWEHKVENIVEKEGLNRPTVAFHQILVKRCLSKISGV